MSNGTSIPTPIKEFHAHLDICDLCNDHPYDLCPTGYELLKAAARKDNDHASSESQRA